MTAKELFDKMLHENNEATTTEMMVEFARMKVLEALNVASEKAEAYNIDEAGQTIYTDAKIDKESILNAYSLAQIK